MPEGKGGPVVVFSGGGTGGHLYPALALVDALGEVRPDAEIYFLGAERGIESRILPEREIRHRLLPVRGLERGRWFRNLGIVAELVSSVRKARRWFREIRPSLVVVTGGYASGPAGLAAATSGIPLALQEQNSFPGVTNRLLSRWAKQIHLAFPEAERYLRHRPGTDIVDSGNPTRPLAPLSKPEARRRLGLPETGVVVLVIGGSQGSRALNELIVDAVGAVGRGDLVRPDDMALLWISGPTHEESVRARLAPSGGALPEWLFLRGYLNDVEAGLAAADVAVSRAGAMTTSEFMAAGLPSILIPLPTSAEDHQTHNARVLADAGASLHLPQKGLAPEHLWDQILGLTENADLLAEMSGCARRRARPQAARKIAARIARLLPERAS